MEDMEAKARENGSLFLQPQSPPFGSTRPPSLLKNCFPFGKPAIACTTCEEVSEAGTEHQPLNESWDSTKGRALDDKQIVAVHPVSRSQANDVKEVRIDVDNATIAGTPNTDVGPKFRGSTQSETLDFDEVSHVSHDSMPESEDAEDDVTEPDDPRSELMSLFCCCCSRNQDPNDTPWGDGSTAAREAGIARQRAVPLWMRRLVWSFGLGPGWCQMTVRILWLVLFLGVGATTFLLTYNSLVYDRQVRYK